MEAEKNQYQQNAVISPVDPANSIVGKVVNRLKQTPYLGADDIAKLEMLNAGELNSIYKTIQISEKRQLELASCANGNYFNTVQNHFGKKQYTVVFFVGLYCPARCHFCPSVKVHDNGHRQLFRFQSQTPEQQKLDYDDFERIFHNLEQMQSAGTTVNIKISGGLEPFTDPRSIGWILQLSKRFGMNSTIFTNGMLLKLEKNRELALKCDNLRISLSTTNAKDYINAYFGNHKKVTTLPELMEALNKLVRRRDHTASKTRIGINVVAGDFNFHELDNIVHQASAIGLDYVEIKGEYFGEKTGRWFDKLENALDNIRQQMTNGMIGNSMIHLTGSLERDNFYNNKPEGFCHPADQAAHKLFINPFGECTPVHCWAYPSEGGKQVPGQFIGAISKEVNLFDLLTQAKHLPHLNYAHLNPFELVLSLESERIRRDLAFGIRAECNPYLPHGNREIKSENPSPDLKISAF